MCKNTDKRILMGGLNFWVIFYSNHWLVVGYACSVKRTVNILFRGMFRLRLNVWSVKAAAPLSSFLVHEHHQMFWYVYLQQVQRHYPELKSFWSVCFIASEKKIKSTHSTKKKKLSSRCERLNKKPLFPNSKSCSRQIFMLFILRLTELAHELLQIPNFSLFSHGVYLLWIKLNILAIISRRSLKYLWFLLHVCVFGCQPETCI